MTRSNKDLNISPKLYVRDPQTTDLGKKMLQESVVLIDETGFEEFGIDKLARHLEVEEDEIYQYFESKHQIFVFLLNWYWEKTIVLIDSNTAQIHDPIQKLKKIIDLLVQGANYGPFADFIDDARLQNIVIRESAKGYRRDALGKEHQGDLFFSFEDLCSKITPTLLEINARFPYPRTLASTLIETANNTLYFAHHNPKLLDLQPSRGRMVNDQVIEMVEYLIFNILNEKSVGIW